MSGINRRDLLRQWGRAVLLPAGALAAAPFLAGCRDSIRDTGRVGLYARVGLSAAIHPTYIPIIAGPLLFGSNFGLNMTKDDYTAFDSHSTVVLAALSGQVDMVGASTMAHLAIIAQGQPFKIFAPYVNLDDFVIAGRGHVKRLEQLLDPNVTVAIDDVAGAGQTIFDAMLLAEDAGFLVRDLPSRLIIGSTPGRTSALASGEVDVTALHLYQAQQVHAETGDVNIISTLYESVPLFMMLGIAAPQAWLDENLETAAAFTASVIQASRDLKKSFARYEKVVGQFMAVPPSREVLQSTYDLAIHYDMWATNGGLEDKRLEFMIELGKMEGVFDADLTPADVVDTRARDMALEMLGSI